MRTALIAWDYPPAPSGLSTAAREIAESLAAAGAQPTVFTLDREGRSMEGAVSVIGCGIARDSALARLRLLGGVGHLAAPLAFRRAVLTEHARQPFAVVEATNWYAPATLLAGGSAPPLVTRNSTPAAFSRDPAQTARDRFDGWMADRLERRQARGSAALISNTGEHARRIAHEYGLREGAQPHAVIGLSLPPDTIRRGRAARYPRGEAGEAVRLLFVGRAEHRKGFDTLMEAVAILGPECGGGALAPFQLILVGVEAAELPSSLPASARRRVRALGRLREAELAAEYERAHAVVAPSRYESFGLVYQEAMAYGRPLVASREDASARAFVGETGAGAMARENTGAALADAIRPLIRAEAPRLDYRERALAAAGRFTRETLGDETLALYEQAMRHAQGR